MTERIGFIGLGTMGAALALRLVEAGIRLRVWNRSPDRDKEIVDAGATRSASIAEVFAESDIVLSMLSDDTAVDAAFNASVLAAASDRLHINMATVSPKMSRLLQERHVEHGVGYVAAPVLGRPAVAAAGQLNVVTAGPSNLIDRAEPILAHLAKRVWRVGEEPAQASLVKIGVNYNLIHTLQALGESLSLMERGKINSQTFVDILTDTAFTGSAYVGYGGLIAQREYRPAGFSVELGLKDLSLTQVAADDLGVALPTAPVIREMFLEALADPELADGDWSIIAEVIRRGPSSI